MKQRRLLALAAVAGLCLGACQPQGGSAKAPAPPASSPAGAPTLDELKSATYTGLEDLSAPVTLKDGLWEGEPCAPGGASRPTVSLARGFRVTGDLDGDGEEEAVVVLALSSGGSGTLNHLAVVKRADGGVSNVATAVLGDRVAIRAARIADATLRVSVVRAGDGDAMCCPGELADLAWTLSGGRLAPAGSTGATGRLSLDTLAGAEWVLRDWDMDEPAPAEPEVTLAYQDGRFTGTSGCNRYNAAAKPGEQPGDLSVGPSAGTMRACPDPQAAVETRFLRQLSGAVKYGFHLGRLAVTYGKDGGVGVMLFEERGRQTTPAR